MRYKITDYTKIRARLLGVIVKPSVNPDKKLDVFDKGLKSSARKQLIKSQIKKK
jgi:hypothetical protein